MSETSFYQIDAQASGVPQQFFAAYRNQQFILFQIVKGGDHDGAVEVLYLLPAATAGDIPRVISLIDETLAKGLGVILFPEGTSTMGNAIRPFSPALLEPAARAAYPVSYAAIRYATPPSEPPAHAAVCWWGDRDFVPHFLKLLMVSRFDATIVFGEEAIQADDRKVLAKALRDAVGQKFTPVVNLSQANQLRNS